MAYVPGVNLQDPAMPVFFHNKRKVPTNHMSPFRRIVLAILTLAAFMLPTTVGTMNAVAAPNPPLTCHVSKYDQSTVIAVQRVLGMQLDGVFGPASCKALKAYQLAHGIQPGAMITINDATLKAMGIVPAPSPVAYPSGKPVPPNSGTGQRVVVSQGQKRVWLVKSDGSVKADNGDVDNPAVLEQGTFKVVSKYASNPADRDSAGRPTLLLQNFVGFAHGGNIGFHKIPIRANGLRFHDESYLGKGQLVSNGCIRLGEAFSDTLFKFVSIGTPVVVVP